MVSVTEAYLVLLVGSVPFILAALYRVLNNMHRRGARPLAVLLAGTLIWLSSALALELAPTFTVGLWANRFQYFGIVAVPLGFFLFALAYAGRDDLVNRYSMGLLSIEPIAAIALVWTNRQHELWTAGGVVAEGQTYVSNGAQTTCDAVICFGDSGVGFLAHTYYSYVLLLAGAVLVLSRPIRSSAVPRGQAISMAIAVGTPLAANVLSLFVLPNGFPDLTPVAFGIAGVAMVVGLYRYSLVETTALTGAARIDERDDGAVLVDDDEVVDLNVDAATVLGVDADTAIGASVEDTFAAHDNLRTAHREHPTQAAGDTIADPIAGREHRVDVEEIAPEGTGESAWLYEFRATE